MDVIVSLSAVSQKKKRRNWESVFTETFPGRVYASIIRPLGESINRQVKFSCEAKQEKHVVPTTLKGHLPLQLCLEM